VGGRERVEGVQRALGDRGRYRQIEAVGGSDRLREVAAYAGHPAVENASISSCGA